MENIEHILEKGKNVKLSSQEKAQIKSALISRIQKTHREKFQNDLNWYVFIRKHVVVASFVTLLFVTGTTSALAEKTAPGDLLYPLKTGVNEQVLGLFATSQNAKALWQVSLAQRRLTEAEHIALSDNPQPEISDDLIAQVDLHIKKASEEEGLVHDDVALEEATIETPKPVVTMAKQSSDISRSRSTFSSFKSASFVATTSVSNATSSATTSISNEDKGNSDDVIEKIHTVQNRLSNLKSKRGSSRKQVQAEIELINAKKELFQKKTRENQKTKEFEKETGELEKSN